jgi:hypothetical protein
LLFQAPQEMAEEGERRRVEAEERGAWANCLAALAVAVADAKRPMRRFFADADSSAGFVDTDPWRGMDSASASRD